MRSQTSKQTYRIIDANLNRAKEGLRVCEDIVRFIFNNKNATYRFKGIRHSLDYIIDRLDYKTLLKYRDVKGDVGRGHLEGRLKRGRQKRILRINIQRVKESLRVLEEFLKDIDERLARRAKNARYRTYLLEKSLFKRL